MFRRRPAHVWMAVLYHFPNPAGLAQLVEHLTCNHEVVGSIPTPGSTPGSNWVSCSAVQAVIRCSSRT